MKALFFRHAKGVDVTHSISNIIFDEEFNFPTDHVFNLSSDGPNVNKTIWKRIYEACEEKKMEPIIAFIPCNLHVVHNFFQEGLNLYCTQTEELAFDLNYWFKRSPGKHEDFLELQEDTELDDSLFIRHVQTRWCSLSPALERIQKKCPVLKKYF